MIQELVANHANLDGSHQTTVLANHAKTEPIPLKQEPLNALPAIVVANQHSIERFVLTVQLVDSLQMLVIVKNVHLENLLLVKEHVLVMYAHLVLKYLPIELVVNLVNQVPTQIINPPARSVHQVPFHQPKELRSVPTAVVGMNQYQKGRIVQYANLPTSQQPLVIVNYVHWVNLHQLQERVNVTFAVLVHK